MKDVYALSSGDLGGAGIFSGAGASFPPRAFVPVVGTKAGVSVRALFALAAPAVGLLVFMGAFVPLRTRSVCFVASVMAALG